MDQNNQRPDLGVDVLAEQGVSPIQMDTSTGVPRLLIEIIPVTDNAFVPTEAVLDDNNEYVSLGTDTLGILYPLVFDSRYPNQNQLWADVFIEP
jgi:hypothetical protein